ncbi:MAG: molybdopterin oxidoreductase [Rhodocyclaceae bacterium]|jgi:Ni/Fe-hydrogenase subunit HybB-like protein|nr:MAG: molybdopterin oxidoreductase [Rhodocyclaceae bacterium]
MNIAFREIQAKQGYWLTMAVLAALAGVGVLSALYMEHHGHIVTGMTNQIVWGLPHVFAVFLIVAASGALNVASIATVFGKTLYKPLNRLSALMALTFLAGGLMVLVLDLGRADRIIVAMTEYNFKSIFAWNVILYNGFFVIVIAYLWTMMDRQGGPWYKAVGTFAFVWRLILTTGTGSIFGFLVAREAYDAALLAPMFIIFSFNYGLALFMLILMGLYKGDQRPLGDKLLGRMRSLLGTFVAASLYFTLVYHLTNLYFTKHHGLEAFLLLEGGVHTQVFWLGQVLVGYVVPMTILFNAALSGRGWTVIAAVAAVLGGLSQMWVTIVGGQAYPIEMFPGYAVSSSFYDGAVHAYSPSMVEVLLGVGGLATAILLTVGACKVLRFMPERLDDETLAALHGKH